MQGLTKQEVESEVAACSRKARKDLRKDLRDAVAGGADPATWQSLRAAVLCIGLGDYEHLPCLPNAQRDARALYERVNELPRCRAKLLVDLPDRKAIQRGIRNFLKEPGLRKMPPETVYINYSGHGMQKGATVYMLPEDADLDPACDPDAEFLPLRDIFKYCREDLDMLARDLDPPRQVTFVLVVEACRVAEMDQVALSSSLEPPAASAPKKWAVCFSCSRDAAASDGPQGHTALLHRSCLTRKWALLQRVCRSRGAWRRRVGGCASTTMLRFRHRWGCTVSRRTGAFIPTLTGLFLVPLSYHSQDRFRWRRRERRRERRARGTWQLEKKGSSDRPGAHGRSARSKPAGAASGR